MKLRGVRWTFLVALLAVLSVCAILHAAGPLFQHKDPEDQREFVEIYSRLTDKTTTPKLFSGAGAPTYAPTKIGDLYISTTTGKVYLSTATATAGSWAIVN